MPPHNVGLTVLLDINMFRKNYNWLQNAYNSINKITSQTAAGMNKSTGSIAKSFDELSKQSKVFDDAFQKLKPDTFINFATAVNKAFDSLGKGAKVNVAEFDKWINSGLGVEESMRRAAGGAYGLTAAFPAIAASVGIVLTAFTVLKKVVDQSVESYSNMVTELRTLQLVLGTTSRETAAWGKIARDVGSNAGVLERSMLQLERQLTDVYVRQLEGEDVSNAQTRALDGLGVAWKDVNGNMRPVADVMQDVITVMQQGEITGVKSAQAVQLFGRTNRDILPILYDSQRSLEEEEKAAARLGYTLTQEDAPAFRKYQAAVQDAKDSSLGFWSALGRGLIPTLTWVAKVQADWNVQLRLTFLKLSALAQVAALTATGTNYAEAIAGVALWYESVTTGATDAAEAAQKEANAAANAAWNEEQRANSIEELTRQFVALAPALEESLAAIQKNFARQWEDLYRNRTRQWIEDVMQGLWDAEDRARDFLRRQQDIERDHTRKMEDIRKDYIDKVKEQEDDSRKQREKLERDHIDRLAKIQRDYYDSLDEAVRQNDAVAVVRAMRERAREVREEGIRYGREKQDLEESLKEKRDEVKKDYEKQRQEEEDRRKQQLEDAQRNYDEQYADYLRAKERERILRELHNRWAEEDMRRSQQRQEDDAREHYNKEKAALETQIATLKQTATTGISATGQAMAVETARSITAIGQASITAAEAWARRFLLYSENGMSGGNSDDLDIIGGRDAGGIDILNKPSMVSVAGSGPEALISIPIPRGTMSVNHSFSPLPVDIRGAGSVDTAQVNSLIYKAMAHLARELYSKNVR